MALLPLVQVIREATRIRRVEVERVTQHCARCTISACACRGGLGGFPTSAAQQPPGGGGRFGGLGGQLQVGNRCAMHMPGLHLAPVPRRSLQRMCKLSHGAEPEQHDKRGSVCIPLLPRFVSIA